MEGHITRITVIGLEDGRKRTLVWEDGALTGDDDLKTRFQQAWDATDHEKDRLALDKHEREDWIEHLARDLMSGLFAETLDLERAWVSTPEKLQEWADAWNSHEGNDHHYTIEEMAEIEAKQNWNNHHGPPYQWDEIEKTGGTVPEDASEPPTDFPKCLECLQPMEWIWFCSSPWTWQHLCGRAGWTAICRRCKSWRPCREEIMN